jgi:hypothetical protein
MYIVSLATTVGTLHNSELGKATKTTKGDAGND